MGIARRGLDRADVVAVLQGDGREAMAEHMARHAPGDACGAARWSPTSARSTRGGATARVAPLWGRRSGRPRQTGRATRGSTRHEATCARRQTEARPSQPSTASTSAAWRLRRASMSARSWSTMRSGSGVTRSLSPFRAERSVAGVEIDVHHTHRAGLADTQSPAVHEFGNAVDRRRIVVDDQSGLATAEHRRKPSRGPGPHRAKGPGTISST